jgi:hypothetical protein
MLAKELLGLLEQERNRNTRAQLREVSAKLGAGGASNRAAETILRSARRFKNKDGERRYESGAHDKERL